jgi:hypothetical protein
MHKTTSGFDSDKTEIIYGSKKNVVVEIYRNESPRNENKRMEVNIKTKKTIK